MAGCGKTVNNLNVDEFYNFNNIDATKNGLLVLETSDHITEPKVGDIALLDGALDVRDTLESVINSSPVVVFLWGAEENWPIEFVSKNIDMLGYSVEDFTSGKLVYGDIVHPDDISRVCVGVSKLTEGVYSDLA